MKFKIVKAAVLVVMVVVSNSFAGLVGISNIDTSIEQPKSYEINENYVQIVYIAGVDISPEQPWDSDMITIDVALEAGSLCTVEYDQFTQNGTSLQLDLYLTGGVLTMFSTWDYPKTISPLSEGTYNLNVRAFLINFNNSLQDSYSVDFTVVPEPATFGLFSLGFLAVRSSKILKAK